MNQWLTLITSLPTENATVRMRAWRALKACGAAVLRDGVYLLPDQEACRATLDGLAADVLESGGTAHVLQVTEPEGGRFTGLFDRSDAYAALQADIAESFDKLSAETATETLKQARKLRKAFASLAGIDFFPGEAKQQVAEALQEMEQAAAYAASPDEPHAMTGALPRLQVSEHQGRTWATRRRPWVDRLACAWLIRRFIDPQARLLWLDAPGDCPPDALGFDFDGATFSHVGARVSFEVMLASFGLGDAALHRLGALVHFLDVGGVQPPEAAGIESVLAGLSETVPDDDQLLAAAGRVFDALFHKFSRPGASDDKP
jgi:hypothetical protein